MQDEFVKCKSAEEGLLLALIDRTDRFEELIHKIWTRVGPQPKQPATKNALDDLKPKDVGDGYVSEQRESEIIAEKLRYKKTRKDMQTLDYQVDAIIGYPANLERLQRNGFQVRQLCQNYARIEWTKQKVGPSS